MWVPLMVRRLMTKSRLLCNVGNVAACTTLPGETVSEISVKNDKVRCFLEGLRLEFYNLGIKSASNDRDMRRLNKLNSVVSVFEQRITLEENIESLKGMDSQDKGMMELVAEEKQVYSNLLNNVDNALVKELLTLCDEDECDALFFEVSAGIGGQEAMLFAKELLKMYMNFLEYKRWDFEVLDMDHSDLGGLRHATLLIYSKEAYSFLKYEAGVHRVQRVPATEKSGRMHTSTVTVAVVSRPNDIEAAVEHKDLKIETKRASGAGGQHVNTTDSAVRITHVPTGVVVECQTERSQIKNKEIAIKKLQSKLFQALHEAQEANKISTKKSQVGTRNRNEKIRTYNFTQDRITDHRIKGGTRHDLDGFLQGGEALEAFIKEIYRQKRTEELLKLIHASHNKDKS